MKLANLGEKGLLERLRKRLADSGPRPGLVVDIGDDAAAVELVRPGESAAGMTGTDKLLLFTCDMLVEGVHFRRSWPALSGESLGWKALAINISDIAAMGGRPTFALVSLALPGQTEVDFVDQVYSGLLRCANEYGVTLAGGDSVGSPQGVVIDVSLLGEVERGRILRRSGARPGNFICVTGPLGAAAAALHILESRRHRAGGELLPNEAEREHGEPISPSPLTGEEEGEGEGQSDESLLRQLTARLFKPRPRLAEGQALAATGLVSAMMDLSDGLGDDLPRLCQESKVGARILAEKIPIPPDCTAACQQMDLNPLEIALRGGEDYELLFTCTSESLSTITAALANLTAPIIIGEILPLESGIQIIYPEGSASPLPEGFEHFSP